MGTSPQSSNRLLASLPRDEYAQVAAALRPVTVKSGHPLCRHGREIRDVFFPGDGAFSLEKASDDGRVAEIALVGSEGIVSAEVFYGATESPVDCQPLVSGVAVYAMNARVFRSHFERRTALHNVVVRYQQALMSQIVQTTACSALHSAEQRTCRWLLMVHDRLQGGHVPISHRRLAEMLGLGSQAVTRTSNALTSGGAIEVREDGFNIVDRGRIEAASCECYHTMRSSFERLLPEIGSPRPDSINFRERA